MSPRVNKKALEMLRWLMGLALDWFTIILIMGMGAGSLAWHADITTLDFPRFREIFVTFSLMFLVMHRSFDHWELAYLVKTAGRILNPKRLD